MLGPCFITTNLQNEIKFTSLLTPVLCTMEAVSLIQVNLPLERTSFPRSKKISLDLLGIYGFGSLEKLVKRTPFSFVVEMPLLCSPLLPVNLSDVSLFGKSPMFCFFYDI